jgi:hypothetical protein
MATARQVRAAKRNIERAQKAASSERTISKLPAATRHDLGQQGARARARHGKAGHALEDRTRQQLYDLARERAIPGRSTMGKAALIGALRAKG